MASVTLRLFASARIAAGTDRATLEATDLAAALSAACETYGTSFAEVLDTSRVWLNGETADPATPLADGDEIAVLPPVSGGG